MVDAYRMMVPTMAVWGADEFMKVFNGGYFVELECGADLSADTIEAKMKIAERQGLILF